MTKILTERAVSTAKPKPEQYSLVDGTIPGLRCLVHPTGKKVYRLSRRLNGKLTHFTVGEDASMVTLAEARDNARVFIAAIVKGSDPRESKRAAAKAAEDTVASVAVLFFERYAKPRNRTAPDVERLFARDVLPTWGRRPIASIKRNDALALLDAIVDRGAPVSANRVYANGKKMFSWAVERGFIETSPFDHVKAPTQEKSRDRTPDDFELSLILRAADTLGYPFGPYFQMLALTGQRRDEVSNMRWSELNEDLSLWTLPRERSKNNLPHSVPVAPWVKTILLGLPRFAGSDFVLTSIGKTAISGYSKAKAALDAATTELNGGEAIPPWRIHDLRRAMASGMARLGVQLPVVEKVLNHVSGSFGGVQGIYQRHEFRAEKREALERWADHLLALETGAPAATNVIEITKVRV